MPLFDAAIDSDIQLLHTRHEAAAVHMADAWGRLTGRPGVAAVTAGPGFANTLSALYVASVAESPLVLLSGASPNRLAGRGAFQEMPQAEIAGHVVKASWSATDPAHLGRDISRAFRIASSGRPGPVHLSLPVDLLEGDVDRQLAKDLQPADFHPTLSLMDGQTAEQVLETLRHAERPLILTGPASVHGDDEQGLSELEEQIGVPVIPIIHPRGVADPNLGKAAQAISQADVVMLLGKRLDFSLRFGSAPTFDPSCRWILIDADSSAMTENAQAIGDNQRILLSDLADTPLVVQRLVQFSNGNQHSNREWLQEVKSFQEYRPVEWQSLSSSSDGPLHPVELCREVQKSLDQDDDAVLIADGGEFGQWAQAGLSAQHRIINGPSGAIGSALPFAVAARLAFPESTIVTALGDGTFGFHPMEFDTAVRYELPFIALVGNDHCWNAENQIQLRDFGPDRLIGCELLPTRYDRVAEAMGGHGEYVANVNDLPSAWQRALQSSLPTCVNVEISRHAAPKFN